MSCGLCGCSNGGDGSPSSLGGRPMERERAPSLLHLSSCRGSTVISAARHTATDVAPRRDVATEVFGAREVCHFPILGNTEQRIFNEENPPLCSHWCCPMIVVTVMISKYSFWGGHVEKHLGHTVVLFVCISWLWSVPELHLYPVYSFSLPYLVMI